MATFAEAHEWAKPEFVDIAAMRLNVIADCRRLSYAPLKAEHAQRVFAQLMPPDLRPAISGVPLVPLRWSAAGAHSLAIIAGRSNSILSHAAPIIDSLTACLLYPLRLLAAAILMADFCVVVLARSKP